jgi:hypothetical protein
MCFKVCTEIIIKQIRHLKLCFDDWLTVHRSITSVNFQLDAKNYLFIYIYNTFIKILYMFRAVRCLSSGGLIVSMQHLISSLSVGDCPVHRLRKNWLRNNFYLFIYLFLNRCTGQSPTDSDDIRCCIYTIRPPEDEQGTARNM